MTSMAIDAVGTYASTVVGGNLTVGLPAGLTAGKLMGLMTGCNGGGSIAGVDTALNALGWVRVSSNVNVTRVAFYLKYAGGSESSPVFQWDASHQAFAVICSMTGNLYADLATIVAVASDRLTNATGKIAVLGTAAPSFTNCFAIRGGFCLKTSLNNSQPFLDWATDSGIYTPMGTALTQSGTAMAAQLWTAQQTTAAATSLDAASLTQQPDTNANTQGFTVILKTAQSAALAGTPHADTAATGALATQITAAGAAAIVGGAGGALTNWTTVTLTSPLYTGPGGILDPNFWLDVLPGVGTTLYYDATHITIYPTGEISSDSNDCSAVVQFFDGTSWSVGLVILTPQLVSYTNILAAATGALTTAIKMAAAAVSSSQASGGLTTGVAMAANALAVANAAATILTSIQLNVAAQVNFSAGGALSGGQASLVSNAQIVSQAVAGLTAKIQLVGQVLASSTVAGALSAQVSFDGIATSLASANAQLTTAIRLAGSAAAVVTAAGAALLTSSFAGAASAVTSALGTLQTGLLVAGQALVGVSGAGDLSTGVSLGGGAIVDIVSGITPPGPEAQFGYALIDILSPTGLPVARSAFVAGSAAIVVITYFNSKGEPFVPTQVNYLVQDELTGVQLQQVQPIAAPGLANSITLPGATNVMVNKTRAFELHQVLFQIVDGLGQTAFAREEFEILRNKALN